MNVLLYLLALNFACISWSEVLCFSTIWPNLTPCIITLCKLYYFHLVIVTDVRLPSCWLGTHRFFHVGSMACVFCPVLYYSMTVVKLCPLACLLAMYLGSARLLRLGCSLRKHRILFHYLVSAIFSSLNSFCHRKL